MSLAEKWEEFVGEHKLYELHISELTDRQRAFYAGAEATMSLIKTVADYDATRAEIDRFKGQK